MIISLSAWMMEERSILITFTDPIKPLEVAEVFENRLKMLETKEISWNRQHREIPRRTKAKGKAACYCSNYQGG